MLIYFITKQEPSSLSHLLPVRAFSISFTYMVFSNFSCSRILSTNGPDRPSSSLLQTKGKWKVKTTLFETYTVGFVAKRPPWKTIYQIKSQRKMAGEWQRSTLSDRFIALPFKKGAVDDRLVSVMIIIYMKAL